ncbi:PREDICTED: hyaluronan mediated motility receptor-like isoform X2 [Dinoponera quadriceps]|uniref:Hyaluronan mediated motility receptor-like isoform X2 n=1 Tax=Dinoponera quadriceps TaxID=609295 RepID=A0A6P3WYB3_DINQU|nr:PREDICTED: hyaluronan mediated motility receptor-like isoform X2 [Dinoponera quadriceps]
MSFSKAKIQRFNEIGSEAPPPGAYDPKFDNKVRGLVIEKSDRFLEAKSVCSAECNASVSGKSLGVISIPSFRTPQMPRKRLGGKLTGVVSCKAKGKFESTDLIRSQSMKYESAQHLADLQVECSNKDKTIQEQEKYIEEMKEDVMKLLLEVEELSKKQIETEEKHTKDIETMAELQQEVLNNRDKKHEGEMRILRLQLLEVSEEREREFSARKTIESELRNRATELSKKITTLEVGLCAKKKQKKLRIAELEMRIAELLNTLEMEHDRHDTEIESLSEEKRQLDVCVMDLTQECSNLEAKLEKRQNVILRLQSQLSTLQCELDELKAEYEKLADESIKRISDLTDKHEKEIESLRDNFAKEREELLISNETLKSYVKEKVHEVEETNAFLTEELEDVQRLYKDVSQRLYEAQKELELSNSKHALMVEKYKKDLDDMRNQHAEEKSKLEQLLEDTKEEYLKELENVSMARDKELDYLKQASERKMKEEKKRMTEHAQKMIDNAKVVTRETLAACRAESEERVKRAIVECDAKVNAMIREARNTVEEEMRLAAERYKACLARMETERTALDEKLSQRDAEITKLSATLEELRSSAETQESFSQSLQAELDKAEAELAEKKEELRALKDHIRTEAAEMVSRRKRFEVIMAENQASVVALTNRLAQSNAEVERLQHELERGEDCIREHKDLLSTMRNNSQLVNEQVHVFMEELDAQRGMVDQLEAGSLSEFEAIKPIFEVKIENLKRVAAEEIARLQNDCEKKSLQNDEMKKQLGEMANNLNQAQGLLLTLEERNDAQAVNVSRLELTNSKLKEQLRSQEKTLEENNQLLQVRATQCKNSIDEMNSRVRELSKKVELLENDKKYAEKVALLLKEEQSKWETLENALKQQLQEERARREEAEEEAKKIAELSSRLKRDFEEISGKYADMIGHQNPKQRIKHVAQLKDKIYQLEQELSTKIRLVEQQQKTIEKLKAEEKRSHWKGKENIGIHSTPISSPHKTLTTPLRSRND